MIFYVLAGLAAGICAGLYFPVYIPPEYGKMLSVALMAALDTAFGGIRSSMEGSYDNTVFITGFFTNAVLARKCRRMFLSEGWIKMMSTLYHLPRSRIISTKGLLSK